MKTRTQVKAWELSALEHYSQLTGPGACRLFGICRTTLWKWVKSGRIPEPRYIEAREPRWRLGELVPLLEALPKMSDAPRGLQAQQGDEDSATTPKPTKKSHNVWERLGLSSPKGRTAGLLEDPGADDQLQARSVPPSERLLHFQRR